MLLAGVILIWFSLSGSGEEDYIKSVEEVITSRKEYLKNNPDSPFLQMNETYVDPEYYPINPEYRVNAKVERLNKREIISIANNQSKDERYIKFAWLHFSLLGKDHKLLVLKPYGFGGSEILFCGFADGTSGVETYGGGRYLDVEIGKSDKTTLDFNLAYNPYCAYVEEFVCPLPPAENILEAAIYAGEKIIK